MNSSARRHVFAYKSTLLRTGWYARCNSTLSGMVVVPNKMRRIDSRVPHVRRGIFSPNAASTSAFIWRNFSASHLRFDAGVAKEAVVQPANNEIVLDFLPDKPAPIESAASSATSDMPSMLHYVGDPPFDAIGLASWWPAGRVQYFMEQIHIGLDLPWWATILMTTCVVRLVVFPLVVRAQKNAALMNNTMPTVQKLQEKMTDARNRGDMYDSARYGMELQAFMKKKGVNPLKNMVPVLFQLPIFMSMFVGLRGMANLPVESMMTGGLFWFTDLTVTDPYYLLPLFTSTSLMLQLYFATEGVGVQQYGPIGRVVMYIFPFVLFPFTMNFPAAVTFYWASTNCFSIIQARLVNLPGVREKLGIPKITKWDKNKLPKKGIRATLRESMANYKVQADIADRRRYDEQTFREAGIGKPQRTYKFMPSKLRDE